MFNRGRCELERTETILLLADGVENVLKPAEDGAPEIDDQPLVPPAELDPEPPATD